MAGKSDGERIRVSDTATRVGAGQRRNGRVWVAYDLGGWSVTLETDPSAPFDGAIEMSVQLDLSDDASGSPDSAGITAELLRGVPLQDARKVLRRMRTEVLAQRDKADRDVYNLPGRMNSPHDWARFARAYARAEVRNPAQPIAHLAKAAGLRPNTISVRLHRAKALGLLEPNGFTEHGDPWLILTAKAKALLEVDDDG